MRVVDYLKRLRWSQADLARHSGVSQSTVRRAINGGTVSARSAQAITSAIDTEVRKEAHVKPEDVKGLHVSRTTRKRQNRARPGAPDIEAK